MKATAAVRRDFENNLREMGKTGQDSTLEVFCTASSVYLKYLAFDNRTRGKRIQGYPDNQTTEIPQLQKWLYGLTVPSREQKAQTLLQNVELMINSMIPWVNDRSGDMKMTLLQRKENEPKFQTQLDELHKVCLRISSLLSRSSYI